MRLARASLLSCSTLLAAALTAAGCSATGPLDDQACHVDTDCATGLACTGGACLPLGTSLSWDLELAPMSDSAAAPTEIRGAVFAADGLTLTADRKRSIAGALAFGPALGSSHVVATVASRIPGRSALEFEAEWPQAPDQPDPQFVLTIPEGLLGQSATLSVLPSASEQASQPPLSVQVNLGDAMQVVLPTDRVFLSGRLVTALGDPQGGYTARAYHAGKLVSTVGDTTEFTGEFSVGIPPEGIRDGADPTVTVELAPRDAASGQPRVVTAPITLGYSANIGDVKLPAFSLPNVFRFEVNGGNEPVSGVTLRFETRLPTDAGASGFYTRDATTDVNGRVDVPLIPGTMTAGQIYDVAILPPPGSRYALRCLSGLAVTAGGTYDAPQIGSGIELSPKVRVTGKVLRDDGRPVSNVTIMATQLSADPSTGCSGRATSAPASTTTGASGAYELLLDPGSYRIEYDPPAGTPAPRLAEPAVTITGSTERDVRLPPGAIVDGVVVDQAGSPLPSAGVRVYQVFCADAASCTGAARVEPLLTGQARSDSTGRFRMVLPLVRAAAR